MTKAKKESKKGNVKKEIFEWMESIFISLAFVLCVFNYFILVVYVDGESMQNTLQDGDRLIATSLFYTPEVGDIIVASREEEEPIVKRIIATEGQEIDIDFDTGYIYVDGEQIYEVYIKEPTFLSGDVQFPQVVPEGHYFVMGDNRNNSSDSRNSNIGMIPRENIQGKVFFRMWPIDSIGVFGL